VIKSVILVLPDGSLPPGQLCRPWRIGIFYWPWNVFFIGGMFL